MFQTRYIVGAVLSVMLLPACGSPVGEDSTAGGAASDQIAFQEGDLVIGDVLYACNEWSHPAARAAPRAVVDLFLIRESPDTPNTAPSEEHVQMIVEAGGEILHRFNVLGVRTDIPTEAIPKLVGYWGAPGQRIANHARAVPRRDRFDLDVIVGYGDEPEPLIARFEELGGHLTDLLQASSAFRGVVPDSALPHLRSTARVRFIQHNQIGCTFGG